MDNLPTWNGASAVYSKAQRMLEEMSSRGHVTVERVRGTTRSYPSQEMNLLISALNEGDEERIKGLLLLYRTRFSYLRNI